MPPPLAQRLIQVLNQREAFRTWPLAMLVADGEACFAFLQERWPLFLSRLGSTKQVLEGSRGTYAFHYPGPDRLPFDHQDIKAYIDNLFLE